MENSLFCLFIWIYHGSNFSSWVLTNVCFSLLAICSLIYSPSGTGGGSTYASTCIPNKAFEAKKDWAIKVQHRNHSFWHWETKGLRIVLCYIQCWNDCWSCCYLDESDEGRRHFSVVSVSNMSLSILNIKNFKVQKLNFPLNLCLLPPDTVTHLNHFWLTEAKKTKQPNLKTTSSYIFNPPRTFWEPGIPSSFIITITAH